MPAIELSRRRERAISAIEMADREMRVSGVCEAWYADSDTESRRIARDANGHLFKILLEAAGYDDLESVDMLRYGIVSKYFSRFILRFYFC